MWIHARIALYYDRASKLCPRQLDTKIGPLLAVYRRADSLVLGGRILNAWLAAKYGASIRGVPPEDVELIRELVQEDAGRGKVRRRVRALRVCVSQHAQTNLLAFTRRCWSCR